MGRSWVSTSWGRHRSEEHTSELQSHRDLHSFPTRRSSDLALGRAQTYGDTEGFVKIVADERYGEILGVHILGATASDMIAEATMAIHLEATVEDLAATIHAHPTWPEATAEAALATRGLAIHLLKPRERRAGAPA